MPVSDPKKLPGIFISYRRSDNPDAVGRIYDRLVSEFGKARVFKDVDSIPLGQDFRSHLNDIVGGCAAVLAIIGPKWTDIRNEAGQKRLDDPDDFVRIELEAALARSVPVVPVLVGHAPMPGTSQLPSTLSSLAFRQSIEVRPDPDFHNDATRLVTALRAIIDPNAPAKPVAPNVTLDPVSGVRRRLAWMTALAATAVLATIGLSIPALKSLREPPLQETWLEINTPATDDPSSFALSPDGRQIAFVANVGGTSRLMLRSLATNNARPLEGSEGAMSPFWSPDSRSIGFFANGSLKRLDIGGGAPRTLATALLGRGGTWNANDVILFAQHEVSSLKRVSSNGGTVADVTALASEQVGHVAPYFLPDGKHFLYTAMGARTTGIYLGSLDESAPVRLVDAVSTGVFHPSGWLLWVRSGALLAQRLDVAKAKLAGEPITLAEGQGESRIGPIVSVSSTGWLAFRAGPNRLRQLAWVDRSGKLVGTIGALDPTFFRPRLSPDGRRVAVQRSDGGKSDIWLLDGESSSRLTFDAAPHVNPVWSTDGKWIAYRSSRLRIGGLYRKIADGSGEEEELASSDEIMMPTSWSPDGRFLLFFTVSEKVGTTLRVLPMTGDRKPRTLLETPDVDAQGVFSPDGKWFAYESDSSGLREVYVRPFHGAVAGDGDSTATGVQWQVSTGGGMSPVWRRDGKELYFLNPAGAMMAAPISISGGTLVHGAPVRLFSTHIVGGGADPISSGQYDVAPDGRFLINSIQDTGAAPITLIQNWNPDAGN